MVLLRMGSIVGWLAKGKGMKKVGASFSAEEIASELNRRRNAQSQLEHDRGSAAQRFREPRNDMRCVHCGQLQC